VLLDVRFPGALFKKLLRQPLGLGDLASVNPGLARGLTQLLEYDAGDEEEAFALTWEASYEAFGERRTAELPPTSSPTPARTWTGC
jgi:hypothetical protein